PVIDEQGDVAEASVADSGGHGCDQAALAAARKLKFEPARHADGTPIKAANQYKYRYEHEKEKVEPPAVTTGSFGGKILIQGAGEPLAGARLTLTGPLSADEPEVFEVFTGVDGSFSFGELDEGSYRLSISAPGYDELALTEDVTAGE